MLLGSSLEKLNNFILFYKKKVYKCKQTPDIMEMVFNDTNMVNKKDR